MEDTKLFLFVVDTTENQYANVGRGILNVQVLLAKTIDDAKKEFIKLYRPHILQQIQYNTYVYDLTDVKTNLEKIDPTKFTPLFSHLPLQGGRPPKPTPLMPGVSLDQIAQVSAQLNPPQAPAQPNVASQIQRVPQASRSVSNSQNVSQPKQQFTKEQIELIKSFGAIPTPQGDNAGFNPRINASVGVNGSVPQNMIQKPADVESLSAQQLELLRSAGVNLSDLKMNLEVKPDQEMNELASAQIADLSTISETALSDEDIAKLQQQI